VFISGLRSVFAKHPQVQCILYADDIQVFISCHRNEMLAAVPILESCLQDIKKWLSSHSLILNPKKTEFIVFHSRSPPPLLANLCLSLDGVNVVPSTKVRDLGVILDSTLTMEAHVNNVSKVAFFYLRLISRARRFLTATLTSTLVNSYVFSRIDYCAPLLCGISAKLLNKLQRIVKYSVRMVDGGPRGQLEFPLALKRHGWLPAHTRPTYRLLLMVRSLLLTGSPGCLAGLLQTPPLISQERRSHTNHMLVVKRTRSATGDKSFSAKVPRMWNSLPTKLRDLNLTDAEFRKLLLDHLFIVA
jgi:hypothetical protein